MIGWIFPYPFRVIKNILCTFSCHFVCYIMYPSYYTTLSPINTKPCWSVTFELSIYWLYFVFYSLWRTCWSGCASTRTIRTRTTTKKTWLSPKRSSPSTRSTTGSPMRDDESCPSGHSSATWSNSSMVTPRLLIPGCWIRDVMHKHKSCSLTWRSPTA